MDKPCPQPKRRKRKLSIILAVAFVVSIALGVSDIGSEMFTGLCRALGAVFFILACLAYAIEKAEELKL